MTLTNEEKIQKCRDFWRDHPKVEVLYEIARQYDCTLQELEDELKRDFEKERKKVYDTYPARRIRIKQRLLQSKKVKQKGPRKPKVKGAKKRAFEHYCGGTPRCFWPGGCDVRNLCMLQLHHINEDGKNHRERLKLVSGNFYVALELEGYPTGIKPLCANHHILIHTKKGAYWEEYL